MALGRFIKREKLSPEDKAELIKANFHAKREKSQGLFTQSQEDLMAELGLKKTDEVVPSERAAIPGKKPKKRDPLTKRQRRLMAELGLTSQLPPPDDEAD